MTLIFTPLFAALLTLLFVTLSIRVIKLRLFYRVAIGDGRKPELARAIAAHNNFAQYVPLALVMLGMIEINHAPNWLICGLGIWLVIARAVHAYGISQTSENFKFRKFGAVSTFLILFISSVVCLIQAVKFAIIE